MNQPPYGYPQHQGYGPPGYHHPPPPKKPVWPWIIVGIVGFMALVGIASGGSKSKDSRTDASASPAGAITPSPRATAKANDDDIREQPAETVTAARILSDYKGNEIRGDNAWKGKLVEVTGVVQSIDKGPFGGLYVVLGSGDRYDFHTVHVNLRKSEEGRAADLEKGEKHTFKGTVQGFIVGSVSIREAVLMQ